MRWTPRWIQKNPELVAVTWIRGGALSGYNRGPVPRHFLSTTFIQLHASALVAREGILDKATLLSTFLCSNRPSMESRSHRYRQVYSLSMIHVHTVADLHGLRGHRANSFNPDDINEMVEIRARQRTFHGAYSRTAIGNLGYALTIIRLFDKRFTHGASVHPFQ